MKKLKILMSILYVIVIGCFAVFLLSFIIDEINKYLVMGLVFLAGICIGVLIFSGRIIKNKKKIQWLEDKVRLANSIAYKVKCAGETCFSKIPIGIIVYNKSGIIEWANSAAEKIFHSNLVDHKMSLVHQKLADINKSIEALTRASNLETDINLYGKDYQVTSFNDDSLLYFIDKTDYKKLERKYYDNTLAIGLIVLDNFEEAVSSLDAQERAMKLSVIIGILSDWCSKYDIYIRGYSEKQYILIMNRTQLGLAMENEFKVIEDLNTYCNEENLKITISMGVACGDYGIKKLTEKAEELLDLAQQRGGNQVAVNAEGKDIRYYGGREVGADTRMPVYVRVKTEDLCDFIEKSSNVIIMAHTNTDADAFGASIALQKIAMKLNKDSRIVFDMSQSDVTVKNVYSEIKNEHIGLERMFSTPSEALQKIGPDTLLILVDCQYENMLIDPRVYRKARNIAIIDHHRSNNKAISNYSYLYNKTTSVELIVEMFEYIDGKIDISSIEATLMLLGIIVDTNNLIFRANPQTFAVISRLLTYGATMIKAQKFIRETEDSHSTRIKIIHEMEIVNGKYGIAVCDEEEIYTRPFIAKIADSIIAVDKLHAGFCIGRISKDRYGISARSYDEMNVQLIMEEFEGGGHYNNAAAQVEAKNIQEIKDKLIRILNNQDSVGEQTMKIILTKDVKGKGKYGDTIDIPSGHANYLIKNNSAVPATADNINEFKRRSEQEKNEALKHLDEMKKLKEVLENEAITIQVRVGKEGKMFGTVSTKQIIDEIKATQNIVLDKRKITYNGEINKTGTYDIPILLHKEVTANIKLYVVEKK